jgi:hypothetical protein
MTDSVSLFAEMDAAADALRKENPNLREALAAVAVPRDPATPDAGIVDRGMDRAV